MTKAQGIHLLLENGNGDTNMHLVGKLARDGETTHDPQTMDPPSPGRALAGCLLGPWESGEPTTTPLS